MTEHDTRVADGIAKSLRRMDEADFEDNDIVLHHRPISSKKYIMVTPERYHGMKQKIADLKAQLLYVRRKRWWIDDSRKRYWQREIRSHRRVDATMIKVLNEVMEEQGVIINELSAKLEVHNER